MLSLINRWGWGLGGRGGDEGGGSGRRGRGEQLACCGICHFQKPGSALPTFSVFTGISVNFIQL